ncbi:MAG: hypothetical protein IKK67_10655 [Bacteroidaceae bacterium]|nr:hypothetical protein [Bacteroidaceae bacterium]
MLMTKTLKVAVAMGFMATAALAQVPIQQYAEQLSRLDNSAQIDKSMLETLGKQRFQNLQFQHRVSKGLLNATPSWLEYNFIERKVDSKQPVTRSSNSFFKASYTVSEGILNVVPGYPLDEDGTIYTGNGIMAPMDCKVTYTNTSVGAANHDWMIGDWVSVNTPQISTNYIPNTSEDLIFETMPLLTIYSTSGEMDTYQYGFHQDIETKEDVDGIAYNIPVAYAWNVDPHAESLFHTFYATFGSWDQVLFGSDSDMKSSYIESYDKPLTPMALLGASFFVAAPSDATLDQKEFTVNWMKTVMQDGVPMYAPMTEAITTKPQLVWRSDNDGFSLWTVTVNLPKQIMIDEQFAIIIDGPIDGTQWALLHQLDRTSDKNTAGFIPTVGDYAGRILTYQLLYEGETEYRRYNTSLDIHLRVAMPFIMMGDDYSMWTDSLGADNAGMQIDAYAMAWSVLMWNDYTPLKISTTADWLRIENVVPAELDKNMMTSFRLVIDPLPEGVAGRQADIIFSDNLGFTRRRTFIQGDAAAGIDDVTVAQPVLDPYAPVYDLTGRLVSNPVKGIYLQNGKKIVVK